ncbi:hypothetical protein HJFPF1_07295 [Paramyrothecium foliicola]|nr:hypothetical protein HJFPF1_07295 [Paramyrothecium foliicola]
MKTILPTLRPAEAANIPQLQEHPPPKSRHQPASTKPRTTKNKMDVAINSSLWRYNTSYHNRLKRRCIRVRFVAASTFKESSNNLKYIDAGTDTTSPGRHWSSRETDITNCPLDEVAIVVGELLCAISQTQRHRKPELLFTHDGTRTLRDEFRTVAIVVYPLRHSCCCFFALSDKEDGLCAVRPVPKVCREAMSYRLLYYSEWTDGNLHHRSKREREAHCAQALRSFREQLLESRSHRLVPKASVSLDRKHPIIPTTEHPDFKIEDGDAGTTPPVNKRNNDIAIIHDLVHGTSIWNWQKAKAAAKVFKSKWPLQATIAHSYVTPERLLSLVKALRRHPLRIHRRRVPLSVEFYPNFIIQFCELYTTYGDQAELHVSSAFRTTVRWTENHVPTKTTSDTTESLSTMASSKRFILSPQMTDEPF